MALTRVQSNIAAGTSTAPSVDIGSVPASGDLVVVSVAISSGGRTIAISGYTLIPTNGNVSNGTTAQHAVFYKIATGAGGTDTITASISGASTNWRIIATQYHDSAGGTWQLDRSIKRTGTSTLLNTGTTVATTAANEVWVGVLSATGNKIQSSPTGGFTLVQGAATTMASYLYERIVAATGTATVSATIGSSKAYVGTMATFYAGAAAGTPANTVAPAVTGTTTVGSTLTSTSGTFTNTPTSYAYQWQRDVHGNSAYANIAGETATTHVLTDADDACKLRCVVIASNASGSSAPTNSNAVGPVDEPAPSNTAAPAVTGPVVQYKTLTTTTGTWSNMTGYNPTFGYQWQTSVNGTTGWANIGSAIGGSHGLRVTDVGNYLRVIVTATNTHSSVTATSNVVGPIQGVPVYPYNDMTPSFDLDNVFNKWTGTRVDGSPQTWEDVESEQDYFLRAKQVNSLVSTDGELLNQLQWKVAQFGQPINRIESLTIMPLIDLTDGERIDAGLAREIGDRISVTETPPGFTAPETRDYTIQHLAGQVNVGPVTSATLQFGVWPASLMDFWLVGDEEKSLVGVSTRPAY